MPCRPRAAPFTHAHRKRTYPKLKRRERKALHGTLNVKSRSHSTLFRILSETAAVAALRSALSLSMPIHLLEEFRGPIDVFLIGPSLHYLEPVNDSLLGTSPGPKAG